MSFNVKFSNILACVAMLCLPFLATAQHGNEHHNAHEPATTQHDNHAAPAHENVAPAAHGEEAHMAHDSSSHESACHSVHEEKFDLTNVIMEHIGNSNEFHLFGHGENSVSIPLPCILYSSKDGFTTCLSSAFHHGHQSHNKYVMYEGVVHRVNDEGLPTFPREAVEVHPLHPEKVKGGEQGYICYNDQKYPLEKHSILGSNTSFIDFSISKNVFTMLFASILLCVMFFSIAKAYKTRQGQAPKGIQNFMEPVVNFIIDEVAKPMLGDKYMKFLPYLLTVFFFILAINLLGLIPIFPGGANVTGNIATTLVFAFITFIITNINGNKAYWGHIFWMPGVPTAMKISLAPIEFLGVFIKPISLMIRLFANITAGHIIVLSLIGLIFVFGENGKNLAGGATGAFVGGLFTLFLSVIELIVAFIQAFIFTILSASYFAAATEEHHHEEHH
jgi:F-type H+-transporting ATPase subunit a